MEVFETITCNLARPVASITLNRPAARNAMSNRMVEELYSCFHELAGDAYAGVRAVVVRAEGNVFCSGGDIGDLSNPLPPEQNWAAIARLDQLLRAVNEAPQVVITRVQGAALGGGLGLVCVSDIVIASTSATFALPEVRLGLVPSVISPYVVARIGLSRARMLTLTGAQIGAEAAHAYGLIHEVCADDELDATLDAVLANVLKCAPQALRAGKRLLFKVATESNENTLAYRVDLLNRLRTGEEAQQGMQAFMKKRPAPWVIES
jgi:enoyl-CoA hydratase/carnithine racemase